MRTITGFHSSSSSSLQHDSVLRSHPLSFSWKLSSPAIVLSFLFPFPCIVVYNGNNDWNGGGVWDKWVVEGGVEDAMCSGKLQNLYPVRMQDWETAGILYASLRSRAVLIDFETLPTQMGSTDFEDKRGWQGETRQGKTILKGLIEMFGTGSNKRETLVRERQRNETATLNTPSKCQKSDRAPRVRECQSIEQEQVKKNDGRACLEKRTDTGE